MKKVYKKRDEAVSPVIATILMVAITVVLAAVLYVMVIGFTPPGEAATAGAWNEVKAESSTSGRAEFGQFTGTMEPMDLRIYVEANGTDAGYISFASNTDPSQVSWVNGPSGASVSYHDYNEVGGQVNSGDYVDLSGLSPGTIYSLEVYNVDSSQIVSMTGDSPAFTTP